MTALPQGLSVGLAGRYTLERELGRGGMATVYLATDLKHQRQVALKVLRPELAAVLGPERFTREITLTAGLSHPHILPLLDSGDACGALYYAMPYVEQERAVTLLRQAMNAGERVLDFHDPYHGPHDFEPLEGYPPYQALIRRKDGRGGRGAGG